MLTAVDRLRATGIEILDRASAPYCAGLTAPVCHPALSACSPAGPILGLCYRVLGVPAGLVLAAGVEDRAAATLLSLAVARAFRRQGIGTALLRRLEAELAARGCVSLRAEFGDHPHTTPIVESFIQTLGWSPSGASHISWKVAAADFRQLVQAPWVANRDLGRGFDLFSWADATAEELAALRARPDAAAWRGMDPFTPAARFDPDISVGLRYKGEIVGWMLTQPLRPASLLLYDRLYVMRPHQATGRGAAIVAEALRRHHARDGHLDTMGAVFRTGVENVRMARFVRRRLGPFLTSDVTVRAAVRTLTPQP